MTVVLTPCNVDNVVEKVKKVINGDKVMVKAGLQL